MNMKESTILIIKQVLLIFAAITSVAFVFMVHWYVIPTADDLQFSVFLRDMSISEFVAYEYNTFCGRYIGQFINAINLRLYELFGTLMVGSILMYFFEVLFVELALVKLLKIDYKQGILYAIIMLGLYMSIMYHIHSFFWMCTQGYTLIMCVTLYAYAYMRTKEKTYWYDYLIATIVFGFLGASYEIFAPCVLVFMGVRLLMYLGEYKSLKKVFTKQTLLVYGFIIATIAFFIMVIAPGNWARMDTFAEQHVDSLWEFIKVVIGKLVSEIKSTILRLPYLTMAFILLLDAIANKTPKLLLTTPKMLSLCIKWFGILVGLVTLAFILETYSVGAGSVGRSLCFIALFSLFFVAAMAIFIRAWNKYKIPVKSVYILTSVVAIVLIVFNVYAIVTNYSELEKWKLEEKNRLEYLQSLNNDGYKGQILLQPIYEPEYHCFMDDMIYKKMIPKFTKKQLLLVTQLNPPIEPEYLNDAFRDFYYLNFEVAQDTIQ